MDDPSTSFIDRLEILPVMQGVSRAGVGHLASNSRLRTFRAGEVVFHEGEYGFEFYVVLAGAVRIVKTAADGGEEVVNTLGVESFFGEMGPMVGQPRNATVIAEEDCTLLEIGEEDFQSLIDKVPSFKAHMDEAYLERALSTCLAVVPLFRDLPPDEIAALAAGAELITFERDEDILREGDPADALYLVRRGFVKITREVDGVRKIVGYLRENGWFGEMAIVEGRPRRSRITALGTVEVVRIRSETFGALLEEHSSIRRVVRDTMSRRSDERARAAAGDRQETWAMLVDKGMIQLDEVLVIDLTTCTRCGRCEQSCAATHDGSARLVRKGFRLGDLLVPATCHMCPDPECMKACRFGVITRRRDGSVGFRDHCNGCQRCVTACPFGVITSAELPVEPADPRPPVLRAWEWLRGDEPPPPKKIIRRAVKCDLCYGLATTACVADCPTGALIRIHPRFLASSG